MNSSANLVHFNVYESVNSLMYILCGPKPASGFPPAGAIVVTDPVEHYLLKLADGAQKVLLNDFCDRGSTGTAADRTVFRGLEQALYDERQQARKSRDFARADGARQKLEALGVVLEDTAKGTRWRRKN